MKNLTPPVKMANGEDLPAGFVLHDGNEFPYEVGDTVEVVKYNGEQVREKWSAVAGTFIIEKQKTMLVDLRSQIQRTMDEFRRQKRESTNTEQSLSARIEELTSALNVKSWWRKKLFG